MAILFSRATWCLYSSLVLATAASAGPAPFESAQLTPNGEYTFGIEGPAADLDGNLYVVNFGRPGTIGKLPAGQSASVAFLDLPEGSVGNSIRFDRDGTMFIADYRRHNIFELRRGASEVTAWFHSDDFSQPNDMAIARDGAIYASDPDWKARSGRIWRIAKAADGSVQGRVMIAPRAMGTTNGIDLSPDGRTLYVGESSSGKIWAYTVSGDELTSPRLIRSFEPDTIDGIRTDMDGRLYVARILKGMIAILKPDGRLEREVALKGSEPTNLAFGGADGRTVYVTQRKGGFIEAFRTTREGREHCLQKPAC